MARNLRPGPNWIPGVIIERAGPLSYVAETEDKQIWRRHANQLKALGDGVSLEVCTEDSEPTYPISASDPVEEDIKTTVDTETTEPAN